MPHTQDRKGLALLLLCAVQFMVVLDIAIVNVALPTIKTALDFDETNLSWVINAYTLTFGGLLMLGGRTADLLGRRRMFMVGLALFSGASLVCGLATSEATLIAARAIQGVGAAIISPAALSILTTTFDEGAERNKALGIWGAVAGSGGAAGAILGGVLTDVFSWQAVLLVNIPVGIAAVALAPRLLPEARDLAGIRSFDLAGAVSVTAGLALLI
jgi:MFS family permease